MITSCNSNKYNCDYDLLNNNKKDNKICNPSSRGYKILYPDQLSLLRKKLTNLKRQQQEDPTSERQAEIYHLSLQELSSFYQETKDVCNWQEKELTSKQQQIEDQAQKIAALTEQLTVLKASKEIEISNLESKISKTRQDFLSVQENHSNLKRNYFDAIKRKESIREENKHVQEKYSKYKKDNEIIGEKYKKIKNNQKMVDTEKEIKRRRMGNLEVENAAYQQHFKRLETGNQDLKDQFQQLQDQINKLTRENNDLKQDNRNLLEAINLNT